MLRCQSLDWTRTECALWICIAFAGPAAPRTVAPTSGCLLPLSVAVLLGFLRCANIAPSCLLFSSSFPAQLPQRYHPHTSIGPFMCFAVENESAALPTCAVPHCVSLSPKLPPSSPPSPVCYLPMYYYTMTNHTMSLCISICQLLLND